MHPHEFTDILVWRKRYLVKGEAHTSQQRPRVLCLTSNQAPRNSGGSARRGDETRGDGLAGSPALPRSSMAAAAAVAPRAPLAAELTPSRRLQKYTQPAQAVNWLSRC